MSQKTMIAMLEEAEDVLRRVGCDMTAANIRKVLQAQQVEPRCACGDSFTSDAVCANCLATQQEAEPVALIMCDGKSYDFMVTVEGQKRIPDTGEFVHLYAAQPPAVAVPNGYVLAPVEPTEEMKACGNDVLAQRWGASDAYRAMLAAAPQAASESPVQWPQERDVGRIGDMSKVASLRVGLDADSDVYVCIHGEAGSGSVEFCVPGSGGGKSPRTRAALISLMLAMEADNAESPPHDWWKAREGEEQKGGAA